MKIINRTPHDINVLDKHGAVSCVYSASDNPVRLATHVKHTGTTFPDDSEVVVTTPRTSPELPPPKDGVYYIVSMVVRLVLHGRRDLLVPSFLVKERGRVIGCRYLGMMTDKK